MDDEPLGLTEFFGIRVPPKLAVTIGTMPGPQDDCLDTIHLSQVALGPDAKPGRHVVWVQYSSKMSVIGSLTLGSIEQFQIDFPVMSTDAVSNAEVNRELKISHSGPSDVYMTGYTTHQFLTLEDSESSGLSESGEESEDIEALLKGPRLRQSGTRLVELPAGDDYEEEEYVQNEAGETDSDEEGEEDDEDEDEDEDDDEEISEDNEAVPFPELQGSKVHTFDMDDGDDEDGSPGFLPLADTPSGGLHPPMDSDESDNSESDSGYDEDMEDDAEDTDEQPAQQLTVKQAKRKSAIIPMGSDLKPAKKMKAEKRAASEMETEAPSVPRPGKAAKVGKAAKIDQPAATPGSTPGAAGSPSQGVLADYQNSLNSFLKSKGPTKMAVIGSEVKRASGLPKLKKFVTDRQETYQLDEVTGVLSLR